MRTVSFDQLGSCDLVVDAVYEGGPQANAGADPLSRLLPGVGNQGGFRASGARGSERFVVLFTSGEETDWPDSLDLSTGQFVYYGDNRTPGSQLRETRKGGNALLERVFESLHAETDARLDVPPFLLFRKRPTANSKRSVQFLGLAVPGFPGLPKTEDLVAVWKSTGGQRFQNYRAVFTVLDAQVVKREWLTALSVPGPTAGDLAPVPWTAWSKTGQYKPLVASPTKVIRSIQEQTPDTPGKKNLLAAIWARYGDDPIGFESFAARIFQLSDSRVVIDSVTRASVDGGRDAVGRYLLGVPADPVYAEFALEAKCYRPPMGNEPPNTVGVKEVSRLISRLKHRQFGVLVTTSVIARQAYEEVRSDGHPIVFLCARDLAEILIKAGYHEPDTLTPLMS